MSDVNTPAFCRVLRDLGCPLIYTALLTSHGLVYQNKRTLEFISALPGGVPYVGQIFGGVPDIMAESARILEATGKFIAIDINMGCPAPKVVKGNAGVGLMLDPDLAEGIVKAVVGAVKLPVTVKMRAGWSSDVINCIELAERCAGVGAVAVALHPRTKEQAYRGKADWKLVARMKEKLSVPVIGSGDISSPEKAKRRMAESGCDAVMIGRACRSDPTLPGRTQKLLDGGEPAAPPSTQERLAIASRHFQYHIENEGPEHGTCSLRSHLAHYIKGIPGASVMRSKIMSSIDPEAIIAALNKYDQRQYEDQISNIEQEIAE